MKPTWPHSFVPKTFVAVRFLVSPLLTCHDPCPWPADTPVRVKVYGPSPGVLHTVAFLRATGVAVSAKKIPKITQTERLHAGNLSKVNVHCAGIPAYAGRPRPLLMWTGNRVCAVLWRSVEHRYCPLFILVIVNANDFFVCFVFQIKCQYSSSSSSYCQRSSGGLFTKTVAPT